MDIHETSDGLIHLIYKFNVVLKCIIVKVQKRNTQHMN